MPPQRVGFLCRFGLKTSKDFVHFGLESAMVFEGATVGEYERVICQFKSEFKNLFCWRSDLSKYDIIS